MNRILALALAGGLLLGLGIAAVSLAALTLTTDEAWLLLGIQGLSESGVNPSPKQNKSRLFGSAGF